MPFLTVDKNLVFNIGVWNIIMKEIDLQNLTKESDVFWAAIHDLV